MKRLSRFILSVSLPILALPLLYTNLMPQNVSSDSNWMRISGAWYIKKDGNRSYAFQNRVAAYPWNYNELLNYHSIASLKTFRKFSDIIVKVHHINPDDKTKLLLVFAAEFSDKSRYHNFYGFRLEGNNNIFNKVVFCKSQIINPDNIDKNNNFKLTDISSSSCQIQLNDQMVLRVKFKKKEVILSSNDEPIHKQSISESINRGIVGIGIKDSRLKIYEFSVLDGKTILLHDDFSKDTIKVLEAVIQKTQK